MNLRESFKQTLAPGWNALKLFWLPFCLIQLVAVALVAGYYHIPAISSTLGEFAVWKDRLGVLFPVVSTGIAGALIPEIFKFLTGSAGKWNRSRLSSLIYSFGYFMASGLLTWAFYRFQAVLFGNDNNPGTVACKVFFDMWVYTPTIAHPFAISWFLFRRTNYHLRLTLSAWGWPLYRDQVFPMLLPGWAFWFPMTACIYSLPTPLQIPLFLFAVSAWSLAFMFLASDRHETTE